MAYHINLRDQHVRILVRQNRVMKTQQQQQFKVLANGPKPQGRFYTLLFC
ncbi:hypothetical protein HanIR_Chr16g0790431 [Helianthus annuus]|nr:hypothetical protein HanIR_Chr16g0790431 [Helianthus annuus]